MPPRREPRSGPRQSGTALPRSTVRGEGRASLRRNHLAQVAPVVLPEPVESAAGEADPTRCEPPKPSANLVERPTRVAATGTGFVQSVNEDRLHTGRQLCAVDCPEVSRCDQLRVRGSAALVLERRALAGARVAEQHERRRIPVVLSGAGSLHCPFGASCRTERSSSTIIALRPAPRRLGRDVVYPDLRPLQREASTPPKTAHGRLPVPRPRRAARHHRLRSPRFSLCPKHEVHFVAVVAPVTEVDVGREVPSEAFGPGVFFAEGQMVYSNLATLAQISSASL